MARLYVELEVTFTVSSNRNEIRELMRDWYNPMTGEVIPKDRLEINKLGRQVFPLERGRIDGRHLFEFDLRRDDKGRIEIDEAATFTWRTTAGHETGVGLPEGQPRVAERFPLEGREPRHPHRGAHRRHLLLGDAGQSGPVRRFGGFGRGTRCGRSAGQRPRDGRSGDVVHRDRPAAGLPQYYTYSATNVRLQELSVGYTLPRSGLKVCDITVSLVGRNLWMMYCKAPFDPEAIASTANNYQGIDYFMMPSLRSLGFNVNIKF